MASVRYVLFQLWVWLLDLLVALRLVLRWSKRWLKMMLLSVLLLTFAVVLVALLLQAADTARARYLSAEHEKMVQP